MPLKKTFTPYLMAGAGIGHNTTKIRVINASGTAHRTNFIWQIGIGFQWNMTEKLNFDLSYRYEHIGKFGRKTVGGNSIRTRGSGGQELMIGLTYNFNAQDKTKNNFVLANLGALRF